MSTNNVEVQITEPTSSNGTTTSAAVYPVSINHIGLNVPNLEAALTWYTSILGFRVILGPYEVEANVGQFGEIFADIAGPSLKKVKLAQVVTGNGIGFEMFQFLDPATDEFPSLEANYFRPGPWHISLTHPDVEGLVQKIVESGGKQVSKIWNPIPGQDLFKLVYVLDPFGLALEVMSTSYEQMLSNRG